MNQASIPTICRWIWHHSASVRLRVALICLLGIVRVALGLMFVWVSKLLVDSATAPTPVADSYLMHTSVLLAALMLTEMAIALIVNYISNQAEVCLRNKLRYGLYDHLLSSRWDSASRLHSADMLNRINEDVRVVVDVVCSKLQNVVVMLAQLAGAFVLLFYLSRVLALCIISILPVFLLLSKIYIRKTRALTADIRLCDSHVHTAMQEGLQHRIVVQTLECTTQMEQRLAAGQGRLYERTMSRTRFSTFSRGMVRMGFIAGYLTAFLWSVWHLHTGAITFGTMTAFLQLVARIQNPLSNLTTAIPSLVQAITSTDRLMDLYSLPSDRTESPVKLKKPAGIRLKDVTFAYSSSEQRIFSGFSHDFAPGSKTVVMGETGVGKSTLIKLLLALLRPQQGRIELYDTDKAVETSADTRCNMVYVPQGNSLIEGSVRDNLLLGDPAASEERMRLALHTAVADFVYDLPAGLDTPCGELGTSLSEGQAQRIAIARALLRDGSILLLDEFNSALDRDTAATLIQRLTAARAQDTIIFISHRQEVSDYCDNVLTLTTKTMSK